MLNPALLRGAPGTVRCVDLGDPGRPIGRMVRIRMVRTPINPADLLAIDGRYVIPIDHNQPLGAEGVARVEAAGEAVDDLVAGDLVLPLVRGNWCAVRLVDRSALIAVPAGCDPARAAVLRINPATAMLMLDALDVRPGDTIVQNAAGSAVAAWVRTFAKARGVKVVDVVRRATGELPDALIDGEDLADRVGAVVGGPIRGALDCVAGEGTGRLAACLAPGARLLVFGHLSGNPISVPSSLLTGLRPIITGFSLRPAEAALRNGELAEMYTRIFSMLSMAPDLPVQAVLSFAEADRAIPLARAGGRGRVLLAP